MQPLSSLLKASWQGWLNSVGRASEERRKKLGELVGLLILVIALYFIARATFGWVKEQLTEASGKILLQAINTFMTLGVFILVKDAMEDTIKRFYEAEDTALLLSSPIPHSTVFGLKLIEMVASNLLSMAIWLTPPWVAFGLLFNLPWHFYLALLPVCFCLLVIIMSQTVIVMMFIVRFFSSRRMVQALKILGATIGIGAGFLVSVSFLAQNYSDEIVQFILTRLKPPASDWYPHLWGAKLLMSWLPQSGVQPLRWALQLIGAGIGVPALAVLLASKLYYPSWGAARRVEMSADRRKGKRGKTRLAGRGKIQSLMVKDFLIFIRHRGRMAMIVMLTLILAVVMFAAGRDGAGGDAALPMLGVGTQVMLYSVLTTMGLTWGGYKVEKKTWWLLKSGPISADLLFNSKFLIAALCSGVYTNFWFLLVLRQFRVALPLWPPILLTVTLITAAAVAFNTAIGALPWIAEIGHADRTSVRRPVLRFVTMLGAMIINLILIAGPPLLLEIVLLKEIQTFGGPLSAIQQMTLAGTVGLLAGVSCLSYLLGKRFLRKLLWE